MIPKDEQISFQGYGFRVVEGGGRSDEDGLEHSFTYGSYLYDPGYEKDGDTKDLLK